MRSKILFTPDFDHSDIYHFNISVKYLLAQNLKHGKIPFWTGQLGGGYPLFSEGQIGALFIPNIIFLTLFNFSDGFNSLLIFTLFCFSLGFFLLLREFSIKPIPALLFSLLFTFNGAISFRWVHINLIQTFSLAPFLFLFITKYIHTKKKLYLFLFPFTLSQMVFAGYVQLLFISLCGLCAWYIFYQKYIVKKTKNILKHILFLLFLIVSGLMFSASQILPNILLIQNSTSPAFTSYNFSTLFSLSYTQLRSFFLPFIFGNQKYATYVSDANNPSIFWENSPYVGYLLGVVLLILVLYFVWNRKALQKNKVGILLMLLTFLFIGVSLGKNSLFSFLFAFPPFNLFRSPAKYLLIANFFLIFAIALFFQQFLNMCKNYLFKVGMIILVFFNIILLIHTTFTYHLFLDAKTVLAQPEIDRYINNSSYISLGQSESWLPVFTKRGWARKEDQDVYLFFKNYLAPNSNLLTNKNNYDIYVGRFYLQRPTYMSSFIKANIQKKDENLILDDKLLRLLDIIGIGNIITSRTIENDPLASEARKIHLKKTVKYNSFEINAYQIEPQQSSFFYIPKQLKKITGLIGFENLFYSSKLSKDYSTIEVQDAKDIASIDEDMINNTSYQIKNTQNSETTSQVSGIFSKETLLVFRKNYYPEWRITIDGKHANMFKINTVHIGVLVPKGEHTIVLSYTNTYFKIGMAISIIYLMLFYVLLKIVLFLLRLSD